MTLYDLKSIGLLTVQGKDAVKFLQGQCTQDIHQLTEGVATAGAFCTAKGRAVTNVWLVKSTQDDCIHMLCSASSAKPLHEHLSKYVAFFRGTQLTNETEQCLLIGYQNSEPFDSLELQTGFQAELPGQRTIAMIATSNNDHNAEQVSKLKLEPEHWWLQQDILHKVLWLNSEQIERFIPQNFSFDELGGISYKKGCYTGQEVIARLHFKGQSRKQLYRISWPTIENKTDADIYTETGVAGTIVQETIDADQTIALAVLSDRNLEQLYADNDRRVAVTLLD